MGSRHARIQPQTAEAAAIAYEAGLGDDEAARRARGAFYTPPELVEWILDRALAGLDSGARVLDPACGTGHFLVAAAGRLGGARAVWGSDLDPDAVRIARDRLAALDPTLTTGELEQRVRLADGLTTWGDHEFDAVVGNPPFLGQLRRRTAGETGGLGAYTDTSAAFLHRSLDLVRDGGAVALVQPLSVLAARDAGPVREAVARRGTIVEMWASTTPVFADTNVLTCVPIVRIGGGTPTDPDGWGALAAPAFGIPGVTLADSHGRVADIADCTADFRDQYYGLQPFVEDSGGSVDGPAADGRVPLITTGLIDPAESRWGRVPTRFARRQYDAPLVDVAGLTAAEPKLGAWASARLVPKLLVAGQGRVIEAVADAHGHWLPSVPVLSVVPHDRADVWRLLAITLAPPVVAHAAARFLGTGLAAGSIKVSARQFAALPLPVDDAAWTEGACLAQRAQGADESDRADLLAECGTVMTRAYGFEPDGEVRAWWASRVGRRT